MSLSSKFIESLDDQIPDVLWTMCEAGSLEQYLLGFKSLDLYENKASAIHEMIQRTMDSLVKQGRILWFLRIYKLWLLQLYARSEKDKKAYQKEQKKFIDNRLDPKEVVEEFTDPASMIEALEEFYKDAETSNIKGIRDYEPGFNSPNDVLEDLNRIVRQHEDNEGTTGGYDPKRYVTLTDAAKAGHKRLKIDVGKGWAWWLVPKGKDDLEARSNGHCGTASVSTSKILSLREDLMFKRAPATVSHLTFELVADGALGMMKGFGNSRPKPVYHPAIVRLLVDYEPVKFLRGGGHKPETNFAFSDLTEAQREEVLAAKPDIEDAPSEKPEIIQEWEDNGPSDAWLHLVKDLFDGSAAYDTEDRNGDRSRHVSIVFDSGVKVEDLVESITRRRHNKLPWLAGDINFVDSGDDEVLRDDSFEDNVLGSDFEDEVTNSVMEKVFDIAVREYPNLLKTSIGYLRRKGVKHGIDAEAVKKALVSGKPEASRITELIRRSVAYGYYAGSTVTNVKQLCQEMLYVNHGGGGSTLTTYIQGVEDVEDVNQFLKLDLSLVTQASAFVNQMEEWIEEGYWDGRSEYGGNDGFTSMEYDQIVDDMRGEGFESWIKYDSDARDNWREEFKSTFPSMKLSMPEEGIDDDQTTLPGVEKGHELRLDMDAVLRYIKIKLDNNILESVAKARQLLNLVESL